MYNKYTAQIEKPKQVKQNVHGQVKGEMIKYVFLIFE